MFSVLLRRSFFPNVQLSQQCPEDRRLAHRSHAAVSGCALLSASFSSRPKALYLTASLPGLCRSDLVLVCTILEPVGFTPTPKPPNARSLPGPPCK